MLPPLSVLDLVPVTAGSSPGRALQESLALAQLADRCGYTRYWVAEHHNMPAIASAATSVVIGYLAGGTERIRVGAGGIMLPNHAPLAIAEQFGTLESLYPGRIDLGLGRAPGSDGLTSQALRRDPARVEDFPSEVLELQRFLAPSQPGQRLEAVPGAGTQVPLWMLGSSTFGAQLAAALGLPYAFAAHFMPDDLERALAIYRDRFEASAQQPAPYAAACVNVVVADTDAEAKRLFTTIQQSFTNLTRGTRGLYPQPIDDIEKYWSPMEKIRTSQMLKYSFVGAPDTVEAELTAFAERTGVDEIIVVSAIADPQARLRSYELLASIGNLAGVGAAAS